MSRQVTYLVKRWNHHTPSGGYDCLVRDSEGVVVRRWELKGLAARLLDYGWRKLSHAKPYLMHYKFGDWLAEWGLLARAGVKRPDLVHVLYGDEQLDVLLRHRNLLTCPLVATFHVPTDRDCVQARFERDQQHLLAGLDVAVVVARNQLPDFQRWLGPERVVYVPHGIDTKQFCPGESRLNQKVVRLVTVGDHMRDFEALHRIMDECNHLKLPVEFDVVVPPAFQYFFTGCANMRFHTAIPENELIKLYRQADALLLPVTDATANNAVLEAMACGTPVISTDIGGMPDYVDASAGWLFPKGEVPAVVRLIQAGCHDRQVFQSRRAGARSKALEFDWQKIRGQMTSLYEAVCNHLPFDLKNNTAPVGGSKI